MWEMCVSESSWDGDSRLGLVFYWLQNCLFHIKPAKTEFRISSLEDLCADLGLGFSEVSRWDLLWSCSVLTGLTDWPKSAWKGNLSRVNLCPNTEQPRKPELCLCLLLQALLSLSAIPSYFRESSWAKLTAVSVCWWECGMRKNAGLPKGP